MLKIIYYLFEKFDKNRANLRNNIIKDIHNFKSEHFTNEEVTEIIKRNFAYPKNLEKTLTLIPKNGFDSKEEFINWSKKNIKSAVFASVAFQWIRAYILIEINKYGKIIHIPSSLKKELGSTSIIRLDSINPYTDDNYTDNTLSSYINEEYQTEDETYVEKEKQERLADIVDELLECLPNIDRRIIKKKFGIFGFLVMSIAIAMSLSAILFVMEWNTQKIIKYIIVFVILMTMESMNLLYVPVAKI